MSLINDALKRASQAEANRRRDAAQPPAMQPAPDRRRSLVPVLMGIGIFILLAMAGIFLWRAIPHRDNPAPVPAAVSTSDGRATLQRSQGDALAPSEASTNGPGSAGASPYQGAAAPPYRAEPPLPVDSTNVSGGTAAPPYQAAPAPPSFPELKLQSIFFSRNNPRASINGQIRAENDLVGEVRVVSISSNKVTVEWNGRTKDLILGGD
jgi:hypothetical protein